jgi:hypothetical protein
VACQVPAPSTTLSRIASPESILRSMIQPSFASIHSPRPMMRPILVGGSLLILRSGRPYITSIPVAKANMRVTH